MKRLFAVLMSSFAIATFATATVEAQTQCPPEVAKAKEQLNTRSAKAGAVSAPRSLAGARASANEAPRGQDVQAPRGQDVQAPRGQDVQAPRGQDVQAPRSLAGARVQTEAPRGQDVQAPRAQAVQTARGSNAEAPGGQAVHAPEERDVPAARAPD